VQTYKLITHVNQESGIKSQEVVKKAALSDFPKPEEIIAGNFLFVLILVS